MSAAVIQMDIRPEGRKGGGRKRRKEEGKERRGRSRMKEGREGGEGQGGTKKRMRQKVEKEEKGRGGRRRSRGRGGRKRRGKTRGGDTHDRSLQAEGQCDWAAEDMKGAVYSSLDRARRTGGNGLATAERLPPAQVERQRGNHIQALKRVSLRRTPLERGWTSSKVPPTLLRHQREPGETLSSTGLNTDGAQQGVLQGPRVDSPS
jgi:hypothetical protein